MIVKCPQCSTGYSIPENLITDKPKKMRCSRCKHVFTLMRRHDHAPSGYEEFTGQQHLPQEFAFLKATAPEEAPPPGQEPAARPAPEEAPADERPADAPPSGPPDPEAEPTAQIPTEPPAPAGVSAAYYAGRGGMPAPPPAPAPVHEAWEEEVPLELSGYSIPTEQRSRGAQAFGKFLFVVFALGVVFLGFVLVRNDFSLSLAELDVQIGYAFSGEKPEAISDEARRVDVVVKARTLLLSADGGNHLVVTGDVLNKGFTGVSRVILRGRLVNGAQEASAEVRAPCGKTVDEETIKMTPKGAMAGHYRTKTGELYNCVISVDGSTIFQMVFDDVPADWEKSLRVEVTAVSAKIAE
jgi:predicted Zn finger-like uncharacterized protein